MLVERRGSVGPIMTLMLVPLIGAMGIGAESSSWYFFQRAAQNAADAAVMAAASNNNSTATAGPTYDQEAAGVAASYGFTNGASNATVTSTNAATCPSGGTNCYKVTITKAVPIALATVVGYNGDTTVSGQPAVLVTASAMASAPIPQTYCLIAMAYGLSSGTDAVKVSGGPKANFDGCDVLSNASANCNGQGEPTIGTMAILDPNPGPNKLCGQTQATLSKKYQDTAYSADKSNIPANSCTSYPGMTISGTQTWTRYTAANPLKVCGNLTVAAAGATVTTASAGAVVVIENGNLVMTGNLTAAFGSPMTIVFSNSAGKTAGFVSGGGTLDFGAPTSGSWGGVALYQDPQLTTPTNVVYNGATPVFKVTGLFYAPYLNLVIKGAVNKPGLFNPETGGYSCINLIVDTITVNGTGYIFSSSPSSQCQQAGVTLPYVPNTVQVRQALVQ